MLCVGGSGAKRLSLDSSPRWTSFHPSLLSLLGLLWPSRVYTVFVHLSVRSVPERDPPWAELRENERENRRKDTPTLLYVPAVVNQMGRSCDGSLRWEDPGQLWLMDGRKLRRELATNIKKREKKKKRCWVRGEGALGNLKPSKKIRRKKKKGKKEKVRRQKPGAGNLAPSSHFYHHH